MCSQSHQWVKATASCRVVVYGANQSDGGVFYFWICVDSLLRKGTASCSKEGSAVPADVAVLERSGYTPSHRVLYWASSSRPEEVGNWPGSFLKEHRPWMEAYAHVKDYYGVTV